MSRDARRTVCGAWQAGFAAFATPTNGIRNLDYRLCQVAIPSGPQVLLGGGPHVQRALVGSIFPIVPIDRVPTFSGIISLEPGKAPSGQVEISSDAIAG